MTDSLSRHPVAVTVFLDSEGVDARDAHHVGEQAVRQALAAAGDTLTTRTYTGHQRTARVVDVMLTGAALRDGALVLQPAERLYPHSDTA
ncbi:hypothetical protein GCM10012275_64350 [Longimycelium tulufanense]|uniref:Uncharacterized protein n=1 Tax=Longimycelium tulufanense TaxID=907463 RepID=A0A8J3CJ40_9PSEU|nr:hypothetical protein [Longimycelium tulufanense]GGM84756.1 hypothetical protein GCM10012275_64350 [Longimycelium tulufanense]